MLKIERAIFDQLPFNFEATLKKFGQQKAAHPFTVDVPAPAADPLVEAAYAAGGYEIMEPEPVPEPLPTPEMPPIEPDPRKIAALDRVSKLQGKKADIQLDEIRAVLAQILEMLPG